MSGAFLKLTIKKIRSKRIFKIKKLSLIFVGSTRKTLSRLFRKHSMVSLSGLILSQISAGSQVCKISLRLFTLKIKKQER